MKGTMLILNADGGMVVRALHKTPQLDELQEAVGGNIEHVPYFDEVEYGGKRYACAAFCHEEGKLNGQPMNLRATQMWEKALKRKELTLYNRSGGMDDHLVGTICVVYGDDELMREL